MDLKSYSITGRQFKLQPVYANACGNTFLIYDSIKKDTPAEEVKNAIWDVLPKVSSIDDGLLLRMASQTSRHLAVKMHVLEPDKTEADFCGNGARSVGTYLLNTYGKDFSDFSLVSRRGNHPIIVKNGICFINMGKPLLDEAPLEIVFNEQIFKFHFCDTVEPHLVTQDFFDQPILKQVGDQINQQLRDRFPKGVNVNCVLVEKNGNKIDVMTYERGLYRITQACGTGSTASVAVARTNGWISKESKEYQIKVLGGQLEIFLDDQGCFWLGGEVLFKV